jgi:hypothetical protein
MKHMAQLFNTVFAIPNKQIDNNAIMGSQREALCTTSIH